MDLVALFQQELREIGAVLPGDPGDERALGHVFVSSFPLRRVILRAVVTLSVALPA
jgi:hypothetical protein